ncbi:hypothetical protein CROQUDRAFT_86444 [Cronartium quercuum f. sp. fusiforme G11]|uniref:Uncharacterized protein n=1 Tax=Cronartium quercuum f. sp. fusiforme G11 TaxID=708437 RepID=A0A9P6NTR0_9BASI|nr:hypothetical protein CROQUDRAFT_86444 [Cronartium quercuum f. sp. fusiforme G11]
MSRRSTDRRPSFDYLSLGSGPTNGANPSSSTRSGEINAGHFTYKVGRDGPFVVHVIESTHLDERLLVVVELVRGETLARSDMANKQGNRSIPFTSSFSFDPRS